MPLKSKNRRIKLNNHPTYAQFLLVFDCTTDHDHEINIIQHDKICIKYKEITRVPKILVSNVLLSSCVLFSILVFWM